MNHDPSVPPPSPRSQPESGSLSSAGAAWNNRITRRSFLKRTGGATAGSIVAWNLSATNVEAEEVPYAGMVTEILIQIPAGSSEPAANLPDGILANENHRTFLKSDKFHSGDDVTQWSATSVGGYHCVNGQVQGPASITYKRRVIHNH